MVNQGTTTTVLHGNASGNPSFGAVSLTADVSGTLPVGNGGTGIIAFGTGIATALGVNVGSAGSPVINGGALGTPSSGTLTSATGLPAAGVVGTALVTAAINVTVQAYSSNLVSFAAINPGTGVNTALATNVGSAGAFITFNGDAGTPSALVGTHITGMAASLTAGAVAVSGITGAGTGVLTALAINVGSAGAFVAFNGALGKPSTGDGTNITNVNAATVTTNANLTGDVTSSGNVTTIGPTKTISTRQVFLTGSAATYTRPANVRQIKIRMKGGGGGTGGSGSTTPAGGAGGTTIFNSINANGGGAGDNAVTVVGGLGGTGGTGAASLRIAGCVGGNISTDFAGAGGTNAVGYGGQGGGNGGGPGKQGAGVAGVANSGGGASGPGLASQLFAVFNTTNPCPGAGEGEYVEIIINSPAASYVYTVGAGGTAGLAGTSGFAGAIGGSGYIVVDEYY